MNDKPSYVPPHTQAIFMTATDPFDKEMGPTPEFRDHFRKLLSETRHRDVSLGMVCARVCVCVEACSACLLMLVMRYFCTCNWLRCDR